MTDDRLHDEERHVLGAQRGLERIEVAERDAREAGQQRLEAVGERRVAGRGEGAERQPVEASLDGDDARAAGRRTPDLDRRLDRFRAGAREEHAPEARGRSLQQLVGEDRPQRVDAERELPRRVEVERFPERGLHPRVVAADVVHPEAAEPVEIAVAVGVVEMRALGAGPAAVEADGAQHAHELGVDDSRVKLQLLARMPLQKLGDAEARHALSLARHTREVESPNGWSEVDGALERELRFGDFAAAMAFVNRVAELAEAENHHPDIAVHYDRVTLRWWTHTAGGITDRDRELAAKTDAL